MPRATQASNTQASKVEAETVVGEIKDSRKIITDGLHGLREEHIADRQDLSLALSSGLHDLAQLSKEDTNRMIEALDRIDTNHNASIKMFADKYGESMSQFNKNLKEIYIKYEGFSIQMAKMHTTLKITAGIIASVAGGYLWTVFGW